MSAHIVERHRLSGWSQHAGSVRLRVSIMLQYVVRRILIGTLTLLLVTFVIYALIRKMPGTPLTMDPAMMNPNFMPSEEEIERLNRQYGLDKPWYVAYFIWLDNLI